MAYAAQTIVGQDLTGQLPWLQGDQTLGWYMDALGALFQPVASLVTDIGSDGEQVYQPGYGTVFTVNPRFPGDTAICPTGQLGYLGQYVGAVLPPGATDSQARAVITGESGMQRGTPAAINAAAKRYLTGTQSLTNVPRTRPDGTPDARWFLLIVRPEEAQPVNAVLNPSFAHDTPGGTPADWSAGPSYFLDAGAALTVQAEGGPINNGAYLRVAPNGSTTNEGVETSLGVLAAGTWTASLYVTGPTASAGQQLQILAGEHSGSPGGNFIEETVVIPADFSAGRLAITFQSDGVTPSWLAARISPASATTFYMGGVMVSLGTSPLAYSDGDSSGWVWTGTPGQSPSQQSVTPLIDAVNAVKPFGLQWQLVQTDGSTWLSMTNPWSSYTQPWYAY